MKKYARKQEEKIKKYLAICIWIYFLIFYIILSLKFSKVINNWFLLVQYICKPWTSLPDSKPHSDFFAPHHTLRMVQRSVLFLVCTACLLKKLLICLWLLKPPYLLSCSRYGISDWSKFIPHVLTMCMINNLFSLVARMATKLLRLVHDKKKEAAEGGTCTCRSLTKNKLQ